LLKLRRHIPFLIEVLKYSLTAFGGPHAHLGMMMNTFVDKRRDITENELMDFLSFCQMLPGPSSTQTVTLIAYKRGGILLGIVTLLIWIIPAAIIMGGLSFLMKYVDANYLQNNVFQYIEPMAIGFIVYASVKAMKISLKTPIAWVIMLLAALVTIFVRSPWAFPMAILVGGFITNFTNKEYPPHDTKAYEIKWARLLWFIGLFIVAGVLSELARTQNWSNALAFNLFENFYRFGSITFGGGPALVPIMIDQFVHHKEILTEAQITTGYGLIQAVPGPVFSLCSYIGGLCMNGSVGNQILGCLIGTLGVFLPGSLILFFLFPLYQNLKQYRIIHRALEGIHAVVIGILWGSAVYLLNIGDFQWYTLLVVISTFAVLQYTKIAAPFVVFFWLFLGILT